jgi:hypothetical protein
VAKVRFSVDVIDRRRCAELCHVSTLIVWVGDFRL